MAKRSETDTALLDAPTELTRGQARDNFINKCLHDWGVAQFMAERGCDPAPGHIDKLIEKAGRMFDRLFEKRPVTDNIR